MANAIVKINRRAKQLQRAHKSWAWRDCIEKASAEYRRGVGSKKRSPKKTKSKPRRKSRRVSNVTTASRSHTDRNKITSNIQVGSITRHKAAIRKTLKESLGKQLVLSRTARKKTDRKKHSKKATSIMRELRLYQ